MAKKIIVLCLISLCFAGRTMGNSNANVPILVLKVDGGFSDYIGEILKLEGFNEFNAVPLNDSTLRPGYLQQFEIVILPQCSLNAEQVNLLMNYVKAGGHLIAFRPDKQLAALFGLNAKIDAASPAYIKIDINSAIGNGLIGEAMQIHGSADYYKAFKGRAIARFYSNSATPTTYPAVVSNSFGQGKAIAFLYNLPASIAATRQGNAQFAGEEKDGIKGIRALDMFTDGWVDTSKNCINQADEQMRILSHSIEYLSSFGRPLPRFWYFPDKLKSLVTLTNDGEYDGETSFEPQFRDIESKGASMALYILVPENVSKSSTDNWLGRGNEISGHPDDTKEAENPLWKNMNAAIQLKHQELANRYGINQMRTLVNHWFVWCGKNEAGVQDYMAQAKIEEANKIEMDINYCHYDNGSVQPGFLGPRGQHQGNFTGSGLPLKFADSKGGVVNVYQHFNNVYDQEYMEHKDAEGFYQCFKGLLDRSLYNEVYSYISVKAHNNEYFFSKKPLMQMLDEARKNGIPVWTPVRLLDFLVAKDEAAFSDIRWSNKNVLNYKIVSTRHTPDRLTCMIPLLHNELK